MFLINTYHRDCRQSMCKDWWFSTHPSISSRLFFLSASLSDALSHVHAHNLTALPMKVYQCNRHSGCIVSDCDTLVAGAGYVVDSIIYSFVYFSRQELIPQELTKLTERQNAGASVVTSSISLTTLTTLIPLIPLIPLIHLILGRRG
jgi:hypothetical protein